MENGPIETLLKKRGLKVSGREEELVARVFAAAEQNMPVFLDAASRVAQTQRERESLNGMTKRPPILLSDITLYLMKDHPANDISLQKRLLNEYKEGKAYRLFSAGWLKQIYIHPVDNNCNYCFLKAECTPSMKINDVPHIVWICAKKESGEIHSAFCTCTAG